MEEEGLGRTEEGRRREGGGIRRMEEGGRREVRGGRREEGGRREGGEEREEERREREEDGSNDLEMALPIEYQTLFQNILRMRSNMMFLRPNPFMNGQSAGNQMGRDSTRERERFYYGRFLTFGLGRGVFFPPPPSGGLSSSTLENMEAFPFVGGELDCSICLEEVKKNEIVRIFKCKHGFHKDCVDRWLKDEGICPCCRRRVGEEEAEGGRREEEERRRMEGGEREGWREEGERRMEEGEGGRREEGGRRREWRREEEEGRRTEEGSIGRREEEGSEEETV